MTSPWPPRTSSLRMPAVSTWVSSAGVSVAQGVREVAAQGVAEVQPAEQREVIAWLRALSLSSVSVSSSVR